MRFIKQISRNCRALVAALVIGAGSQAVPAAAQANPALTSALDECQQPDSAAWRHGGQAAPGGTGLAEAAALADPECGCGPIGCVRTQGYWSNKPGLSWPGGWYRDMQFYSSGQTWQQLYDMPVRGNAYVMLAHQFMTAVLNRNAGASAPQGVQDVMAAARDWFASGTTLDTCAAPGGCALQKTWAAALDVYNNGLYPGGPAHCED